MKRIVRTLLKFLVLVLLTSLALYAQVPTISSFTPTSGPIGTSVSIAGVNFGVTDSANTVYFGGMKASIVASSETSITAIVPVGATYTPITVTTNGRTASSSKPFSVTFPSLGTIDSASFMPKVDFATSTNPPRVVIADIDRDGKLDMAVNNQGNNSMSAFWNSSTPGVIDAGSFAGMVEYPGGSLPRGLAIGDLDGDGKLDLVAANEGGTTVAVFRNASTSGIINSSSFDPKIEFTTGAAAFDVAIGDVDGDGKPDIVAANKDGGTFSVLKNTATSDSITSSSFAAHVDFATAAHPHGVALSDVDGDGKLDVLVVDYDNSTVSVYRNISSPDSISSSSFESPVSFPTGPSPLLMTTGDLDGDGKPDLVVSNSGGLTVSVLRNTATVGVIDPTSFAPQVGFTVGIIPFGVAIGDLDGDGKPEIVSASIVNNTISVLHNVSIPGTITSSSFEPKVDFATSNIPTKIAIGDLDGDGRPDLAVTNYNTGSVSVFRNTTVPTPTITSFTPVADTVGAAVEIFGSGFFAVSAVQFSGVNASYIVHDLTHITATVPVGATSGPIEVIASGGTATSSPQDFTVTYPQIVVEPLSVDFGGVQVPHPAPTKTIVVRNTGTASLHIISYSILGGTSNGFGLASAIPFTLAPGESGTIAIDFTPLLIAGFLDSLRIDCDALANPHVMVSLHGEGIDTLPPVVSIQSPAGGELIDGGALFPIIFYCNDEASQIGRIFQISVSTDGGSSWTIDVVRSGSFAYGPRTVVWNVPENLLTDSARLRVTATDSVGNTSVTISNSFRLRPHPNVVQFSKVELSFDPPTIGQIAPPQNVRAHALEFRLPQVSALHQQPHGVTSAQPIGYNIYRVPEPPPGQPKPSPEEIVGDSTHLVGSVSADSVRFTEIIDKNKGTQFVYSLTTIYDEGSVSGGSSLARTNAPGSICGMKYHDDNGNGIYEPAFGETPIAAWKIFAVNSFGDTLVTTTDSLGRYCFTGLLDTAYTVIEEDRTGYVQTGGQPYYSLRVDSSGVDSIDFGNFQIGSISGKKFADRNGNGVDDNEPGLSNWTICVQPQSIPSSILYYHVSSTMAFVPSGLSPVQIPLSGTLAVRNGLPSNTSEIIPTEILSLELRSVGSVDFGGIQRNVSMYMGSALLPVWVLYPGGRGSIAPSGQTYFASFAGAVCMSIAEEQERGTVAHEYGRSFSLSGTVGSIPFVGGVLMGAGTQLQDSSGQPTGQIQSITLDVGELISPTAPLCTATNSNGDYSFAPLLPGTYLVRETQQQGWSQTMPDPSPITITSGMAVSNVDFGNIRPADTVKYRTFKQDSLALATDQKGKQKSVKKKADKVDFKFNLVAPGNASSVSLKFSMVTSGVVTKGKSKVDTLKAWSDSKLVSYSANIVQGDTIQFEGRGVKGKPVSVSYLWATSPKATKGKVTDFKKNIPRLPMPNLINLGEEIFSQGGFPNGLKIGLGGAHSVVHPTYRDVLKSLNQKGRLHTAGTNGSGIRCLDKFDNNKPIDRQLKNLPPGLQNNKLFADLNALKIGIAASQMGKTHAGLGELIYDDGTDNPLNGKMVKQIATQADSFLTLCVSPKPGITGAALDSTIHKINIAFSGALDTTDFSSKFVLTGIKQLQDVPYLHANPSAAPATITPGAVDEMPAAFALHQNYPNPFNPTTTIQFELANQSLVTLKIYNTLGQEVAELIHSELLEEGMQEAEFDATHLSSGVYFYRLTVEPVTDDEGFLVGHSFVSVKKMLMLK